jgi:hypothetical protein
MDVVRSVAITDDVDGEDEVEGEVRVTRMALFSDISIGDAP